MATEDDLRRQLVFSHLRGALSVAALGADDPRCLGPMVAIINALSEFKTHEGDGSVEVEFTDGQVKGITFRDCEGGLLSSTIYRPDGSQLGDDDIDFASLMVEPNRVYATLSDGAEFAASIRGALRDALRMSWWALLRLVRRTVRRLKVSNGKGNK